MTPLPGSDSPCQHGPRRPPPPPRLLTKLSVGPGPPFLFGFPGPAAAEADGSGRCGPGGGSSCRCRCSSSIFRLNSSRKLPSLANKFTPPDTGLEPDTSSSPLSGDVPGPDSAHRLLPPPAGPGTSRLGGSARLPRAAILSPGAAQGTSGKDLRPRAWRGTGFVWSTACWEERSDPRSQRGVGGTWAGQRCSDLATSGWSLEAGFLAFCSSDFPNPARQNGTIVWGPRSL